MTGPRSEKGNGLFPGYTVLTVAGSDSGGGAGVQADLKTIMALDGYGTCAITALTAQNTLGVLGSIAVPGLFIQKQMEAVFSDLPPQAVKIGMLPNAEAIAAVAETLLLQNMRRKTSWWIRLWSPPADRPCWNRRPFPACRKNSFPCVRC